MYKFQKIEYDFDFKKHDFKSAEKELNQFFYKQATNYIKEDYCQMYLLIQKESAKIIGYITLSCSNFQHKERDLMSFKKMVRYVPGILLGQLAVDVNFEGQGFGKDLLKKAVKVSNKISKDVGCRTLIVDALLKLKILSFYKNLGFDFVNAHLGQSVLEQLYKGIKVERKNIKMFLDLQRISE